MTSSTHQQQASNSGKFPVNNSTTPASRTLQRRLIVEEFKEFLDAENQLIMGLTVNSADCLKELSDLVYVCYQYAANLGWDLDEALNRVHQSNMSKLDDLLNEKKQFLQNGGKFYCAVS